MRELKAEELEEVVGGWLMFTAIGGAVVGGVGACLSGGSILSGMAFGALAGATMGLGGAAFAAGNVAVGSALGGLSVGIGATGTIVSSAPGTTFF